MEDRLDSPRSRAAWWAFGTVLGLVVLFVVLQFLGTFVFGVFLYYATRPVYRRVRRYVAQASIAAAGSLFLLALPAMLLVGYVVAVSVVELRELADDVDLGPLGDLVGEYPDVSTIAASPEQLLTDGGADAALGIATSATGFLGLFGLAALHLFVMFAVAFYLLRDDHRLSTWIATNLSDEPGVLDAYLDVVDEDLHSIFFGNILNAAITGTIGAITYSLLNLIAPAGLSIPYAVLVGLLTGVASLIPIVGMKLVYVPVAAYLFARPFLVDLSGVLWFPVAFVVVSVVVVDLIPDLVLRPYISGRNLHVGMVMMAYVLGPLVFGWYGIFLAPLLLVLAYHFARVILPELVSGDPITPVVGSAPTTDAGRGAAAPSDGAAAGSGTGDSADADARTTDGGPGDPADAGTPDDSSGGAGNSDGGAEDSTGGDGDTAGGDGDTAGGDGDTAGEDGDSTDGSRNAR